jgi:hypothetical protein
MRKQRIVAYFISQILNTDPLVARAISGGFCSLRIAWITCFASFFENVYFHHATQSSQKIPIELNLHLKSSLECVLSGSLLI